MSLYELEKDYYLGNYQSCINKANSMDATRESSFYLCLSYFQLNKLDLLELELSKSREQCVRIIGFLVAYEKDVAGRQTIVQNLDSMVSNNMIDPKDDLARLIVSSLYLREKLYANALRSLHQLDTLPSMLAQVGIFLSMSRIDLAERQLKKMQTKDDYATLTLLAQAQVKLASGNSREAYDVAKELEDKYRSTPLLNNIQAVAAISMSNYDLAKQHCESSLDLENDNPEALINMVHILTKLKASAEVKARHLSRIKTLYPDHEFVKELDRLDQEMGICS